MLRLSLAAAVLVIGTATLHAKGIEGVGAPDNRDDAQCLAPFGLPTCADITRATDRSG